jgi:hypothetical protein
MRVEISYSGLGPKVTLVLGRALRILLQFSRIQLRFESSCNVRVVLQPVRNDSCFESVHITKHNVSEV